MRLVSQARLLPPQRLVLCVYPERTEHCGGSGLACETKVHIEQQNAHKIQSVVRWAGADPEILHGRWLMGWLSIVNYTGIIKGVAG